MTRRTTAGALTILLFAGGSAFPTLTESAEAAFPGRNGRIVFAVDSVRTGLGASAAETYISEDLFTISPSGERITQVTDGPVTDLFPQWSPDGKRIAFIRPDTGSASLDIYVVDGSGGEPANLTNSPLDHEKAVSWSPDGTQIVFEKDPINPIYDGDNRLDTDLWIMDADGAIPTQLTDEEGAHHSPAWSPDGSAIAYVYSTVQGVTELRLISPEGKLLGTVLPSGFAPRYPTWSPDGRKIAFHFADNIWVVNRDGSGLRNLSDVHDSGVEKYPSWSPDGKWIVFLASFDPPRGTRLYKMRSDGSDVSEIVDLQLPSEAGIDWGPRP